MEIPNRYQSLRLEHIAFLFENHSNFLFEKDKYSSLVFIRPKGKNKIKAILPLQDHELYGESVLFISEKLDEDGNITQYHYGWELSQRERSKGKKPRHIMAFGNEEHSPGTHAWVESNPFHHHHVPGEPRQRKATTVDSLEAVISILECYIYEVKNYNSTHSF